MNDAELNEFKEVALAYTEDQARAVVSVLPTYILWQEVGKRLTDLLDFRNDFEELSKKTGRIPF